jgi:hypothetical protein
LAVFEATFASSFKALGCAAISLDLWHGNYSAFVTIVLIVRYQRIESNQSVGR